MRPPWWRPLARRRWDRAERAHSVQLSSSAHSAVLDVLESALAVRVVLFDDRDNEVCAALLGVPLRSPRACTVGRVEAQDSTGARLVRISPPDVPWHMAEGESLDLRGWLS